VAGSTRSGQRSGAAAHNIEAILRIEKQDERKLLLHHRALHAVGRFMGTPFFFAIQSLGVGFWLWINTKGALSWRFDEYPSRPMDCDVLLPKEMALFEEAFIAEASDAQEARIAAFRPLSDRNAEPHPREVRTMCPGESAR